jgi:hypothetical protein
MLPDLPYPVLVPVVSVAALAAAGVLADEDAHPVHAVRRALHSAREHAAYAVVTVALVVVCASAPAGRGVA